MTIAYQNKLYKKEIIQTEFKIGDKNGKVNRNRKKT